MRNIFYLLFLALFFAACSGSKEIQMGQLNQDPCKNETQIKDQKTFTGETVDNLSVYQQGDNIFATMDVRTTCDAKLSFEPKSEKGLIILKLKNNTLGTANCACISKVTTSFSNPGKGDYKVRIMSANGDLLLAEQSASIR